MQHTSTYMKKTEGKKESKHREIESPTMRVSFDLSHPSSPKSTKPQEDSTSALAILPLVCFSSTPFPFTVLTSCPSFL